MFDSIEPAHCGRYGWEYAIPLDVFPLGAIGHRFDLGSDPSLLFHSRDCGYFHTARVYTRAHLYESILNACK